MNKPKHLHIPYWRATFSNGEPFGLRGVYLPAAPPEQSIENIKKVITEVRSFRG